MTPAQLLICDDLYSLVKAAPASARIWFTFTSARCEVIHHHADTSEILAHFSVDPWTEDNAAILAQVRAYLAGLADAALPLAPVGTCVPCEPQMATGEDGRWIMKEEGAK